ncbi:MAG: type II toxin-antitoxin system Phd/YefM family antitoxin [Acidobacteriota bacterium]|jgi:prevent-host-death family protein
MENISAADARKQFAELLSRAAYGKERFVVTRHGKEMGAIVPVEDLDLLERLKRFAARKEVQAALREIEDEGTTSWNAIKRSLDI